MKRILGLHHGPNETKISWDDLLEALETLKLEQGTYYYITYKSFSFLPSH
jgi:hypothetical protein